MDELGHGERARLPRGHHLISLVAAAALALALALGTAGLLAMPGAPPVGATPLTTLYAASSAQGIGDCSTALNACDLPTALSEAPAGDTIVLVTAGMEGDASTYYAGNFTVDTPGTSAAAPVTIQPVAGVTDPILDGGGTGSVLTVGADVFVTLNGVTVQHGDSDSGGGIANNAGGTVTVSGATFTNNTAGTDGGAIDNADNGSGTLTVTDSTFTNNQSSYNGGAIDNGDSGGSGTVDVQQSTFTDNTSAVTGGAIDNAGTSTLTVSDSMFTNNQSSYNGGAIGNGEYGGSATATVSGSTFTGDLSTYSGGAIDSGVYGAGTLTVSDGTFSDNRAQDGGAIDSGDTTGSGTLTVTGSTFTGNRAEYDGGAIDQADNGGSGTASLGASTFSDNQAGYDGGGIDQADNGGSGTATVLSATFAGNTAGSAGDTIAGHGAAAVTVAADVFTGSCLQGRGTWVDLGYNVAQDRTCLRAGSGDQTSPTLPSELGALADNGGPTETITLLAGNPGIGAIPHDTSVMVGGTSTTLCPTTDQRGVTSEPGAACNMGALQLAVPRPPTDLTAQLGDAQVSLRWDVPSSDGGSPITGYQVFRGTTPGGEGSTPLAAVTTTSYVDTAVAFGTTYYYVVRAVNAVGSSAPSNEVHVFVSVRTTNTLTSSKNPSPPGPATFWTGVRSVEPSAGVPTGTVRFVVDGTTYKPCESVPLGPGGGASCTVTFRGGTTHVVSAVYPGSGIYDASTSNKVTQKVTAYPDEDTLAPGKTLTTGQQLVAGPYPYRLAMQKDGNLVEYRGSTALWASRTSGHPGAGAVMQKNGDLVVYQGGKALWASRTAGHPGAYLALQGTDGNLVVYGPDHKALWASGT